MHLGKDVRGMYPSLDFAGQLVTACVRARVRVCTVKDRKATIKQILWPASGRTITTSRGGWFLLFSSFMQILCKQRFMTRGRLCLFQNWINTVFRYTWWCTKKCLLVFQPQKLFQHFWREAVSWGWEWALKRVLAWPWVCSIAVHTLVWLTKWSVHFALGTANTVFNHCDQICLLDLETSFMNWI